LERTYAGSGKQAKRVACDFQIIKITKTSHENTLVSIDQERINGHLGKKKTGHVSARTTNRWAGGEHVSNVQRKNIPGG